MTLRRHVRGVVMAAALTIASFTATQALAGTVILEGSDAIGLHSPFDPGAAAYRDQAFSAIGGSDPRPIGVVGTGSAGIVSGSHAITTAPTVAALGALNNYVALYFIAAGGGCCTEDTATIGAPGAAAAVAAYLASGGTVMIQNYTGATEWDFAVGSSGDANAHVIGIGGGAGGGTGCDDGETVTATGLANGFTQPPVIGCWSHQGYEQSFFGPLGFTLSFFDAAPGMGGAGWSSLLSNGVTVSAPEPASMALFGFAVAGLAAIRRRRV